MAEEKDIKPLAVAADWIKNHTGSPWLFSLLLGGGVYGLGRLAWGPMIETFRSIGRPVGRRMMESNEAWNDAMDRLKEDATKKRIAPAIAGILTSAASLYALYNKGLAGNGLTHWNAERMPVSNRYNKGTFSTADWTAGLGKAAAFEINPNQSYVGDIQWDSTVPLGMARSLFNGDPRLMERPGARLTGLSIVNDAALREKTRTPTLGGIFDSAVDKIGKKLTFGGVVDVGVKTAVANGASRLLTGAIGAMCGLSPSAREKLIDAGTWAGAVTAILN